MYRGSRPRLHAIALVCAVLLAGACTAPPTTGTSSALRPVDPHLTDPALPPDAAAPNISLPGAAPQRDRLVVLFSGSASSPSSLSRLARVYAEDGYDVIGLRYSSDLPTLEACPNEAAHGLDCHRQLRGEIVFGADVVTPGGAAGHDHPGLEVTATTSVVNRLLSYIDYLVLTYPDEGWDRYQQVADPDGDDPECASEYSTYGRCDLRWDRIAAIGFSQGAGIALFLGQHFDLDRVGMLSGSFDAFGHNGSYTPAPWLYDPFATDVADIAMLSNPAETNYGRQVAVADAVGMAAPTVDVLQESRPYGYAQRLITTVQPNCTLPSSTWAHSSTVESSCTPQGVHSEAWRYLAGGA